MSYWNKHPELLEEVTIDSLPKPWKNQVKEEEIDLSDIPKDIALKAMLEGTEGHFADMVDGIMMMEEDR